MITEFVSYICDRYYLERDERTFATLEARQNPLNEALLVSDSFGIDAYQAINIGNQECADEIASQATTEPEASLVSYGRIWEVFLAIKVYSISVWLVFTVTIGLFPSLVVFIASTQKCSSSNRFFNDLFTPMLFLFFNFFDMMGRFVAGMTTIILKGNRVFIAAVSRFVFFPLFMFCNVTNSRLPILLKNDSFPFIIMIVFAFSNGYVASACMIQGPSHAHAKDQSLAGTMMAFSLTFGLLSGASLSFLVTYISRGLG